MILDHDGKLRSGLRKTAVANLDSSQVDRDTLDGLFEAIPTTIDISIDLKDPDAFGGLVRSANDHRRDLRRIWVCHPQLEVFARLRKTCDELRFVHTTSLREISRSPELHAQKLVTSGIEVCNMHWRDWSGGSIALFHRFGVACFGWGLRHEREMIELLRMGVDAVYGDDVQVMLGSLAKSRI